MSDLRDFLYLDTDRLHSFVSQIHGGRVSEISETVKQHGGVGAGIDVGIPHLGGKVDVSKGKESERHQTIQLTDSAHFNALYDYLKANSQLLDVTTSDPKIREQLSEGQFVEITGTAEPPVVEYWIARVRDLLAFLDKNYSLFIHLQPKGKGNRASQLLSRQQLNLFKEMISFLEDYVRVSRRDPGKQYIRVTSTSSYTAYAAWCGLLADFATPSLQATLPAKIHVVGRVERLLAGGEVYKIVDFSRFNQTTDVSKLLEALNALGPVIGQTDIKETDLQAEYPDIFVTPVALYR